MFVRDVINSLDQDGIFITRRQLQWAEKRLKLKLQRDENNSRYYSEADFFKLKAYFLLKKITDMLANDLMDASRLSKSLEAIKKDHLKLAF